MLEGAGVGSPEGRVVGRTAGQGGLFLEVSGFGGTSEGGPSCANVCLNSSVSQGQAEGVEWRGGRSLRNVWSGPVSRYSLQTHQMM